MQLLEWFQMLDDNKSKKELITELNKLKKDNTKLNAILEDKKKFADKLTKNERFLSETALEFVELSMEVDIYELLAGKLGQLFKDSIILISTYDEGSDNFRIHSIFDQNKTVDEISRKFFGQGVIGMDVPRSTDIDSLLTGRLKLVEYGLHQLLLGRLPPKSCKHIEKLLNIGEIYNIGLSWKGKWYGAVAIGLNKGSRIENKETVEVLVNMASVALQRRNAENKILEDEAKYRSYVNNAPYGIIITDENGYYLEVNDMVSEITGYSKEELFNMGIPGMVSLNYLQGVMKELLSSQETEQAALEFKFLHKNGETRNGAIKGVKLPNKGYMGFLTDITQRKKAEEALKLSKIRLKNAMSLANLANWEFDVSSKSFIFNDRLYSMLGTTAEQEGGYWMSAADYIVTFVHPEDAQLVTDEIILSLKLDGHDIGVNLEYRIIRRDGEIRHMNTNIKFVKNDEGNLINVYGTNQDITELKVVEKELKQSLKEKEMLLKEIHHRVKNNLMVISSLLNLQSKYIKDKTALNVFRESQNRAKSMALIHERLYRSKDLKRIDFGDYIRTLAIDLFHTYVPDPNRIKLNLNLENIMVDINTAVPLGLIVNELVTNSMKHAFGGGESGEIKVQFYSEDENLVLKVSDNGIGFPGDLDFKKTSSLGLQLVNSLTNQIDGEIELNRTKGTEFKITFKEFGK
jgi:PAS domain S-box-containing protein